MENVKWLVFFGLSLLSLQCQVTVKVPTQTEFYQLNVSCNACHILKKSEFFLLKFLRGVLFNLSHVMDVYTKTGSG